MWNRPPVPTALVGCIAAAGFLAGSCDKTPTEPGPVLTITRVEPSSGPVAAKFPVRIHGTGFESGATVTLGGQTATVSSVTPTMIIASVPPHAQGAVDIVVTNPRGARATLVGGFTYLPGPIPIRTPPATVSATVLGLTETGGWVPVPNLRLKVLASGRYDGAVDGIVLPDKVTDAQGRFTVTDNSAFILFFQTYPDSEYRFLCDWSPLDTNSPLRELPVVHTSWSGNRPPPGLFGTEAGAWGTVSEQIDGSLQPVTGATVILDDGIPDPPGTTSATGFYKVCSVVGSDQIRTITVSKSGYNSVTREFFSYGDGIHIQLTRR